MRQSWEESKLNQEGMMKWIAAEKVALTPYVEMRKWRRRFWAAVLVIVGLVLVLVMRGAA